MRRPILRLATRLNRRTRLTAWAIALACMALVGSLSLVEGLRSGADSVLSRVRPGPALYTQGDDLLSSRIDPDSLDILAADFDALRIHTARLEINGLDLDVIVASIERFSSGIGSTAYPIGLEDVSLDQGLLDSILQESGSPVASTANLTLFGVRLDDLPIVGPPPSRSPILPNQWAYVRPELLLAADPQEGDVIQGIATASALDSSVVASLELTKLDLIGVVGFVRGSVEEVEVALLALDVVIAGVIALLVFFAISLEVHERTREIRTLRSIGASPFVVALVYEGQALTLSLVGAILGSALGVVLTHGFVSFAPLIGLPNLVVLEPPLTAVGIVFGSAVLASVFGAIVPSRRAALLIRRRQEAVPS